MGEADLMALVSILVPGPPPPPHRQATIASDTGAITLTVPLLAAVGIDNAAARWSIQDRPGREPMTVWAGPSAVTGSVTVLLGNDLATTVEKELGKLRTLALGSRPVVISCGQYARWSWTGTWIITSLAVDQVGLIQGSNDVAQAAVTLQLAAAMTPEQIRATGR